MSYIKSTLASRYFTWYKRQDGGAGSDQDSEDEEIDDDALRARFRPQWDDEFRFLKSEMATMREERGKLGPGAELKASIMRRVSGSYY